jgi:hypothetical protein
MRHPENTHVPQSRAAFDEIGQRLHGCDVRLMLLAWEALTLFPVKQAMEALSVGRGISDSTENM